MSENTKIRIKLNHTDYEHLLAICSYHNITHEEFAQKAIKDGARRFLCENGST